MKRLTWIFALLPLLGIMSFYFFTSPPSPSVASSVQSRVPKKTVSALTHDTKKTDEHRRSQEIEARLNASMARNAKSLTPERIRLIVDAVMQSRGPRYHALFESWHLDPSTTDNVLKVIRERETRVNELQRTLRQTGVSGRRDFLENHNIERELANIQLNILLGENRFKELALAESEMEAAMRAEAQKLLTTD